MIQEVFVGSLNELEHVEGCDESCGLAISEVEV
jgi:hypothetical protein